MSSDVAAASAQQGARVDAAAPIVFFDGECGFCSHSIRFAMSRDHDGRLFAAPLSGETAQHALQPFASMLAGVDSVVLYRPATPSRAASAQVYSDGALGILRFLGGAWPLVGAVGLVLPRWIRDGVYKFIMKHRYRLFGRADACQLWPPSWRARILP